MCGPQLVGAVHAHRGHHLQRLLDARLLVAADPLGLVGTSSARARFGSWVATPTGQVLVWQRWAWMQPTAIIIARAALV